MACTHPWAGSRRWCTETAGEIVRRTRHSRKLVRQAVRDVLGDVFRVRQSFLDAYLPVLLADWEAGCSNGAEF